MVEVPERERAMADYLQGDSRSRCVHPSSFTDWFSVLDPKNIHLQSFPPFSLLRPEIVLKCASVNYETFPPQAEVNVFSFFFVHIISESPTTPKPHITEIPRFGV